MRVPPGAEITTRPNCRTSLRSAITESAHARRNWVQIVLICFCMSGMVFNIANTATTLTGKLVDPSGLSIALGVWTIFLFFWLATQVVVWLFGAGALGRLVTGRALSLREALDDMLLHRR
ncbi:MAG: hypothetical protein AAGD13_03625 [Pseudomonadota bacterium]